MTLSEVFHYLSHFEESIHCKEHELIFVNRVPVKLFNVVKGGFSDFFNFGNHKINDSDTEHNIEAYILKNDSSHELELLHKLFVECLNKIRFPLYDYLNLAAFPDPKEIGLIDLSSPVDEKQASELINWIEHLQTDLFISTDITEVINSHMNGQYSTEIQLDISSHKPILFRSKQFIPTLNTLLRTIVDITESARRQNYLYLKSIGEINYLDFNSIVNQIGKVFPRSIVDEFLVGKNYGNELSRQVLTCYYLLNKFDIGTDKFIKIITRANKNQPEYKNYPYIDLELNVSSRAVHDWLRDFRNFYTNKFLKKN